MIVRPNKSFETNSLFPNSNWYTDEPENYVVDETTEAGLALAQKIMTNYPNFTFVIVANKLVDVDVYEAPTEPAEPVEPVKSPEMLRIEALEARVEALEAAVQTLIDAQASS